MKHPKKTSRLKRLVATASLILCFCTAMAQKTGNITGTWEGIDGSGEVAQMIFSPDGFVTLKFSGQSLGGENFEIKGKKADLKYQLDTTKDPMWLDIIGYERPDNIEKGRMKALVRFTDADTLEMTINFDGTRPAGFDQENADSITLTRKK